MKTSLRTFLLITGVLTSARFAAAQAGAVITEPAPDTLIQTRLDFPVAWSIGSYEEDRANHLHYWVAVATVNRKGEPTLHWPKQYVKQGHGQARISDGGSNPLPTPQPVLILLLRVDDAMNQRILGWFEQGPSSGYPGFEIKAQQIVARVPVRFP